MRDALAIGVLALGLLAAMWLHDRLGGPWWVFLVGSLLALLLAAGVSSRS